MSTRTGPSLGSRRLIRWTSSSSRVTGWMPWPARNSRALAVPGAQAPETFVMALERIAGVEGSRGAVLPLDE